MHVINESMRTTTQKQIKLYLWNYHYSPTTSYLLLTIYICMWAIFDSDKLSSGNWN